MSEPVAAQEEKNNMFLKTVHNCHLTAEETIGYFKEKGKQGN